MSENGSGEPYASVHPEGRRRSAEDRGFDRVLRAVERTPLSRRSLLRAAVVTPAAGFLAACTRRVSRTTPRPTTGGGTGSPTASPVLEDELNIYNWAAYLNPENRKAFAKLHDVSTTIDFYSSNEELIAKLQGGATGYDIVAPTGYAVQIMAEEGLLLELDHDRLPNLRHVDPRFLDLSFDPGNRHSVPKDWGTTGFGYLRDKVDEEMRTWADFYRLAEKYSGRYTVLDSAPEVVGSALKMLGYSYNTTDQAHVDEALDKLLELKPHVAAITSSEYRQMMSRGDAWIALGWNGDFFYVTEDQPSVRYVVPEEGTEYWIDTWAVPASAPHPNIAHEFINWILQPEIQGRESNYTYYASCVTEAVDHIDPAIKGDPSIYPSESVIAKLEANDGDPLALDQRSEAWTKFKSA